MLSIVPLVVGGGPLETGAGSSAPKHVQQFATEDYSRWNSLSEFLAPGPSPEHLARAASVRRAAVRDSIDQCGCRFSRHERDENDASPVGFHQFSSHDLFGPVVLAFHQDVGTNGLQYLQRGVDRKSTR